MRIWFESEGTPGVKKKRFFAVVEEEMIDKNGRPVAATKPVAPVEPEVVPEPVAETTATPESTAPAAAVVVTEVESLDNERLENLEKQVGELNEKVDRIIATLEASKAEEKTEEVAEEAVEEEPAENPAEEPAEEKPEEVVEEVPAEAAPEEEPVAEEATEEAVAEESSEEETVLEQTEETPAEEELPAESTEESTEIAATAAVAVVEDGAEVPEKKPYTPSPNFAKKMLAASEIIQDRYDELKNYALRFRKLKSRISKKFDSINMGRFHFVKLSVAGKTLKLYLNMDIDTVDPKFHCVDMSTKKTYVTVPVMLRIKSGRAMKYAKRLIDQCAQQHEMLERRKPFEVDAMQLIEESLKTNVDELPENDADIVEEVDEGTEE